MSNLFVLDLCDTLNTQDPRDGRTSLMTAVLDNDEVLCTMKKSVCFRVWFCLTLQKEEHASICTMKKPPASVSGFVQHPSKIRTCLEEPE